MKKVKVLIPFIRKQTGKEVKVDAVLKITDEELERIQAINVNMVEVLGDVEK